MYIISITIHDNLSETQQQELLTKHRAWFKQHFEFEAKMVANFLAK